MPTPKAGESQQEYVSRCIQQRMNEGEKDNERAAAVCYSMWREHQKKSQVAEFSLVIRSVGLNKKTGERYWKASTSDIYPDSFKDEMSLELYKSFIERIKSGDKPPIEFRSEEWEGGMPYVSIAHYREHSIVGDTDRVYIDGSVLKANGTFRNNDLGIACFDALCNDLYQKSENDDKIRISIAFLDYMHRHKSNGLIFERKSFEDRCPECLREMSEGTYEGKKFLDGLLIHFAMTRVPVNKRTSMEVDKSMTTKLEDAASIIGEEKAKEIDQKEKELVGKSEAIVIKSDEEEKAKHDMHKDEKDMPHDEEEMDEEKKKEKKSEKRSGAIETPVVEVAPTPVAITEPKEITLESVLAQFTNLEKLLGGVVSKLDALFSVKSEIVASHPLDAVLAVLKSDFNTVALMQGNTEDKLRAIQTSFGALGEEIKKLLATQEIKSEAKSDTVSDRLLDVIQKLSDKIDLLASQQKSMVIPNTNIPSPRSINPAHVPQMQQKAHQPLTPTSDNPTPLLKSLIDRSVNQ